MVKVSEQLKELLARAIEQRDKAATRELSYWQGYVDALEQTVMTAEITELKNERNNA